MNTPDVAVVDYGLGNLLSVRRGLEYCGATVLVTEDPDIILSAPRVVLPGVGAFAHGMDELNSRGLDSVVREVASQGSILLGICLGMQMLFDESVEFGRAEGLGLIPGKVVQVPSKTADGLSQKIPHIGWNGLVFPFGRKSWESKLLREIKANEAVYFVHSFMAVTNNSEDLIANCLYGGISVPAIVGRDNVYGCQFHPEKSGEVGLRILRGFLSL